MNYFAENLADQAYDLAVEIWDGKWSHVPGNERPGTCDAILSELRKRCPGFSLNDYQAALAKGLQASK